MMDTKTGIETRKPTRVLVVGSGLAGLTTAYLLTRREGFEVDVFEMGDSPALDAGSISCPSPSDIHTITSVRRIDIPMRSFTPPYYPRLCALLSHLSLSTSPQNFTFTFPKIRFPSNLHSFPSRSPTSTISVFGFIAELIKIGLCYLYFTVLVVLPLAQPDETETLSAWAKRWWLPERFMAEYVAPLMGAVTSADSDRVGQLPAIDVITYRRTTLRAGHVVVAGGIGRVQEGLVRGIENSGRGRMCFGRRVVAVEDVNVGVVVVGEKGVREGVKVTWTERLYEGVEKMETEWYEKVVFATSPDAVMACWKKADVFQNIPVWPVEVLVEREPDFSPTTVSSNKTNEIVLAPNGAAVHRIPGGLSVSTRPRQRTLLQSFSSFGSSSSFSFPSSDNLIAIRHFTRVGKTVEARRTISKYAVLNSHPERQYDEKEQWRCGQNGVYVVGAWCWDGMVLLEGCVQSAERVVSGMVAERMSLERREKA